MIYYGRKDDELLEFTEKDEAIEMILDSYHPDPIPKMLELVKFQKKKITATDINNLAEFVNECAFERLEDLYGNFEEDHSPSSKLKELSEKFANEYSKAFNVLQCEEISSETIDCVKWVKENASSWLEEGLKFRE